VTVTSEGIGGGRREGGAPRRTDATGATVEFQQVEAIADEGEELRGNVRPRTEWRHGDNLGSDATYSMLQSFRTSGVLSYFDFHLIGCNLTLTRGLLHGVDRVDS